MNIRLPLYFSLVCASAHLSQGEPIPQPMLGGLASEDFLDREKSQEELLVWARGNGKTRPSAIATLLSDEDPEIRKRSYAILRKLSDEDYLSDGQGYLGIMMGEEMWQAEPEGKAAVGIRISRVIKDSPADCSGLKAGDLIIALDGKTWGGQGALDVFMETIAKKKPLEEVVLTLRRNAPEPIDVTVTLGKRPIPDLRLAREDPQTLDMKAKDEHFKEWLKRVDSERK